MSNRPVQVLFLAFVVPRSHTTGLGGHWNSPVLVNAALLEDRIEEYGKASSAYSPLTQAADMEIQFMATCVTATVLPLWGMIGIWQDKFGYVERIHSSLAGP